MNSTYLEEVEEGVDDVRCATLDVVESTEPWTLDRSLTVLEGREPFGVEVLGTAGEGVVWGGGVCEVVVLPS